MDISWILAHDSPGNSQVPFCSRAEPCLSDDRSNFPHTLCHSVVTLSVRRVGGKEWAGQDRLLGNLKKNACTHPCSYCRASVAIN